MEPFEINMAVCLVPLTPPKQQSVLTRNTRPALMDPSWVLLRASESQSLATENFEDTPAECWRSLNMLHCTVFWARCKFREILERRKAFGISSVDGAN